MQLYYTIIWQYIIIMVHYPLNHQGSAWYNTVMYGTIWYGNARTIVRWYSTCTVWCCTGWLSVLRCQQWPARRVNYVALVPPGPDKYLRLQPVVGMSCTPSQR